MPKGTWPASSAVLWMPVRRLTTARKISAAAAIADLVGDDLFADFIVPSPFDERVAAAAAAAVLAAV